MTPRSASPWASRLAVALGIALTVAGASRGAGDPGGLIAFARSQDGAGDIWVARADGRGERALTRTAGNNVPRWSSDGARLAFVNSGDVQSAEVEVVDVAGGPPRRLTRSPGFDGDPAWSPDGARIAWTATREGAPAIWVMDPRGGHRRRIGSGTHAEWSPDGRRLAYLDPAGQALGVRSAAGGRPLRVTARRASPGPSPPAWSPDGRRIAFVGSDGRLYVVRPDGGGLRRMTPAGAGASAAFPAWSPDGRTLAFVDARGGAVYAVGAGGGRPRRLARDADALSGPTWSRDGRVVAFVDDTEHVALVGADGRGRRRLTHGPVTDANPVWQPAPRTG